MKKIKAVIAGNPNSGKTCIFNRLTRGFQKVGNFPGVTVDKAIGKFRINGYEVEIVDIPGTYSLIPYTEEEKIAKNSIWFEKPDIIIDVIDSSNFTRNLFLTTSLAEYNIPMVAAFNMVDTLDKKGKEFDLDHFKELTGIFPVLTVGNKNKGIEDLKQRIVEAYEAGNPPHWEVVKDPNLLKILKDLENQIKQVQEKIDFPAHWLAVKILEDSKMSISLAKAAGIKIPVGDYSDELAKFRYMECERITEQIMSETKIKSKRISQKIDDYIMHPVLGFIVFLLVLYAIFKFTFFVSDLPYLDGQLSLVGWLERFFEFLSNMVEGLPEGFFKSLLQDGVIGGVGAVMSFVPLIFFLFLSITLLEDSGYMSRISFLMDGVLKRFGLQGASVFPIVVSGGIIGGCAVPGIMACRIIRSEKERLATMLVAPFTNCGAKLPVYAMLIAAFFQEHESLIMFLLTMISWLVVLFGGLLLRKTLIRGEGEPFIMEIPDYHFPSFSNVFRSSGQKTWLYMKKAGTIILGINILIWIIMTFPRQPETIEEQYKHRISQLNEYKEKIHFAIEEQLRMHQKEEVFPEIMDHSDVENLLSNSDFSDIYDSDSRLKKLLSLHYFINQYKDHLLLQRNEDALRYSIAGRFGTYMEYFMKPLGFDFKINIALVGGFAAKEVIVGTLGVVYAMEDVDPLQSETLSSRIAKDTIWDWVTAFVLMVFVMLYAPCFATIAMIKKETGRWRWAIFSFLYSTAIAYIVALVIKWILNLFV